MPEESTLRILLIEDSPSDAQLISYFLEEGLTGPFELHGVDTLADGIKRLHNAEVDLVLLDLSLPDSAGIDTFNRVRDSALQVPIVVLSGVTDEAVAVTAVRQGAQDYIVKGSFDEDSLRRSIRFAIERSKRLRAEQELMAAEAVQQRLYPSEGPAVPDFDIAGWAYPAEKTSGDYFDFIPMDQDRMGIVVGDVSGHGLAPALLMVETRAYLRAITETNPRLDQILTQVNRLLAHDHPYHFVTLFFAQLDPQKRIFTYASAGHQGHLLRADGTTEKLESTGPVLGMLEEIEVPCAPPIQLESGDVVLLPTDGIEEAMSPERELFGMKRTLNVLRANREKPASEIVESLYRAAREHAQYGPQRDDICAVIIKVK